MRWGAPAPSGVSIHRFAGRLRQALATASAGAARRVVFVTSLETVAQPSLRGFEAA